eukprot:298363-Prorocentrum_minimum.AAC.1
MGGDLPLDGSKYMYLKDRPSTAPCFAHAFSTARALHPPSEGPPSHCCEGSVEHFPLPSQMEFGNFDPNSTTPLKDRCLSPDGCPSTAGQSMYASLTSGEGSPGGYASRPSTSGGAPGGYASRPSTSGGGPGGYASRSGTSGGGPG